MSALCLSVAGLGLATLRGHSPEPCGLANWLSTGLTHLDLGEPYATGHTAAHICHSPVTRGLGTTSRPVLTISTEGTTEHSAGRVRKCLKPFSDAGLSGTAMSECNVPIQPFAVRGPGWIRTTNRRIMSPLL